MRQPLAETPQLPAWAEGLPNWAVSVVRQLAMRRGVRPEVITKEWTVAAARSFTAPEFTRPDRTPSEGLPPEEPGHMPT